MEPLLIFSFFATICLSLSSGEELLAEEPSLLNHAGEYMGHGHNNRGRSNFKCPFWYGAFPDPDNCSKFYVCVMGKAISRQCRKNTKFDMFRLACVRDKFVVCGGGGNKGTTTNPSTGTTKKPGPMVVCPSLRGQFPDPEDCSKYYQCTFFIASPKTCPSGQLFDAVLNSCQPADKVHCGDRLRPGETTTTTTTDDDYDDETTPTGLPTTTEKVRIPPPETDCPEGDDDCLIDKMGDPDDWFKCPEADASFPHPSSERLFIFCMNWEPSVKKCGLNMVFSTEFFVCLQPLGDGDDDHDDDEATGMPVTEEPLDA